MTFPTTPLDIRGELYVGGRWTDITDDVQQREDITISAGKSGESSATSPTQMNLTLNNRLGKYSPKNPVGAYFNKIGRNTPIRTRTRQDSGAANWVSNSTFETDVSGWIAFGFGYGGGSVAQSAVQAWQGTKSALVTWPTFSGGSLIGTQTFNNELIDGRTYTASLYAYVPTGNPDVRLSVAFLSSSSFMTTKDAWTRITLTFVAGGLAAGVLHGIGIEAINTTAGQICYIDGVMIEEGSSASTFTTTAPQFSTRATLEVTSWPKKWDTSGNDAYVQVEATGRLSRDSQSDHPVNGGLQDLYMSTTPIIYWPLTDGATSVKGKPAKGTWPYSSFYEINSKTVISSFGSGHLADYLSPVMILDDTFSSAPSGSGFMQGTARSSNILPDSLAWEFCYRANPSVTQDGSNMGALITDFNNVGSTAGTFDKWTLEFRPDGTNDDFRLILTLDALGESPTVVNLADSNPLAALTDGLMHHVRFQLTVNGANVDYVVYLDGTSVISGTRNTYTLRDVNNISMAYDRQATEDTLSLGHIIIWETLAHIPSIASTSTAAAGYAGETAGRRFERLAGVAGIPFVSVGNLDDTTKMGLQYTDYYQNQITEIEATDLGMIYEPRDQLANGYRTRKSLYTQTAAITVDYSANELTEPFEPIGDNNPIVNDVFADRREGASKQATLTSGALSVQEPPNGIGRIKKQYPVNTETDEQLDGIAQWLLNLGTVDEDRYPRLIISRENLHVAANSTLSAALLTARMGDLITVTNADAAFIPDDFQLLIVGYREVLNWKTHRFEWVCIPYSPYSVAKWGTGVANGTDRYDTNGSALTNALNTTDTSFQVTDTGGTLWTTAASEEWDINLGGERITVTTVTGGQPSFVGVGTSATANNASVTPGLPASVATGDLVLILASIRNSGTGTVNLPANWTEIAGTGTNFRLMGRIYDGVWTMPTVTFTGGVANADTIAQSAAFRNVTLTGAASSNNLNGSAQDIALPVTTTENPSQNWGVQLLCGWKQDDFTSVATLSDSAAEIGEQSTITGDDASQVWDYKITRRNGHNGEDFVVTGGAAAISRGIVAFLPRAPQTFGVTRSVNGIVKSHIAGTSLRLWRPAKYAL